MELALNMTDMLEQYNPARPLRSLGRGLLVVPRAKSKQGEAAFSHYAAQRWNLLPDGLRNAPTVSAFKSRLQSSLFKVQDLV